MAGMQTVDHAESLGADGGGGRGGMHGSCFFLQDHERTACGSQSDSKFFRAFALGESRPDELSVSASDRIAEGLQDSPGIMDEADDSGVDAIFGIC